ncbi:hypothetical protein V2I52_23320 [Brenneria sp. g21c3]|uniref:hypothetical protein n=1 Tax=Brenneria sp. g21c3 TaxID=3093893 RepID=UPI002EAE6733|nr:hypothetical protein [Brenneria sp. g21c3]
MERYDEIINAYETLDDDERIEYFRNFNQELSLNLALFFLKLLAMPLMMKFCELSLSK